MYQPALICQNCGTVLAEPGGHCKACGFEAGPATVGPPTIKSQASAVSPTLFANSTGTSERGGPASNDVQPLRHPELRPAIVGVVTRPSLAAGPRRKGTLLAVGLLSAVAVATAVVTLSPRNIPGEAPLPNAALGSASAEPASSSAPPANPTAVSLAQAWQQAEVRARAWHRDAQLLSVRAGPLDQQGLLQLGENAVAVFDFALAPASKSGAARNAGNERLRVQFSASGLDATESKAAQPARAVAEPSCPLDEAIRVAKKTGLDSQRLTLRYEFDPVREKSVWLVEPNVGAKQPRVLDGFNCTVIVR